VKIFTKIEELLGKKSYRDQRLEKLKERFNPKKITFFSVEFTNQNREICKAIVIKREETLDLIVEDLEKAENLLQKIENKEIIKKVYNILNKEEFLFQRLGKEEIESLKNYSFITIKPIIFWDNNKDTFSLLEEIFQYTKNIFFFTVNKNEARAWLIEKGSSIFSAASKIHTDLAKGFIRAEVYNIKDLDSFKNLSEAQQRGILKIVDKNYVIEDGDVINIKFKV
jgi:hypothetical protein